MLPILALLLLALGVFVARGHRRALIGAGLGLAASMLVLGAGLLIFRGVYLNSVPSDVLPADAAAALFDTLVRFIKEGLASVLVVGPGRGRWCVPDRALGERGRDPEGLLVGPRLGAAERRARGRAATAPWEPGPTRIARELRIWAVSLGRAGCSCSGDGPPPLVVMVIAILLLVVLGLIELIGRPPAEPAQRQP